MSDDFNQALNDAVERMKIRVVGKMADIEDGQPLNQAAAELGMMPEEFMSIYNRAIGKIQKPPSTIEWE